MAKAKEVDTRTYADFTFEDRRKAAFKRSKPDPNSGRSKRRKARGFVSLEQSSRKHRRAKRRLLDPKKGGSINYH